MYRVGFGQTMPGMDMPAMDVPATTETEPSPAATQMVQDVMTAAIKAGEEEQRRKRVGLIVGLSAGGAVLLAGVIGLTVWGVKRSRG